MMAKTYEDGLNEAWEVARKIVCSDGYNWSELEGIFERRSTSDILKTNTIYEAIDKIKNYEGIKVGDEVTDDNEWEGVVTWISPLGEYLVILLKDGTALHWDKKDFKKTGRHFPQIAEVLKQMKESS